MAVSQGADRAIHAKCEVFHMRGETEEHWRKLCEQAIHEQDPDKLMKLIAEINRLLEEKEERLLSNDKGAKQRGVA